MRRAEDVQQDVLDELAWDSALDAAGIGVAVTDGAVTLSGHVRSYAEKRAAGKAAKRITGVLAVANDLEVRLPSSMQRDDTDIAAAVAAALKWTVTVPQAVTATVQRGWVTLEGEVDWNFQLHAAERAVRDIQGVRGITNSIRLRARAQPEQVKTQIQKAFHRSAQIDADHVNIAIVDGKVTLTGTVRSWSELTEAEHAARTAPGVREVVNNLHVGSFATALI